MSREVKGFTRRKLLKALLIQQTRFAGEWNNVHFTATFCCFHTIHFRYEWTLSILLTHLSPYSVSVTMLNAQITKMGNIEFLQRKYS